MTREAIVFYAIVGGALALCLVVLAGMAVRKVFRSREADKLICMMEAEDWMGWDEDIVNEETSKEDAKP